MRARLAALALAAPLLAFVPAPASAAACPGPSFTDAEYERITFPMRAWQAFAIVGGSGRFVSYSPEYREVIRDFPYCGELEHVPGIRLRFQRALDGSGWWVSDKEIL